MHCQRAEYPLKLDGLEATRGFFAGCFANADPAVESLWVAHVDDQALCVHLTRHGGDAASAPFPLRSIIADAAAHRSAGLVLAHNHPSGDPTPSAQDYAVTKRLACVAAALNCRILDHLVFGEGKVRSFQQMGLL